VKIVVLIPGGAFTPHAQTSFDDLIPALRVAGHEVAVKHFYYPVIHHGRNFMLMNGQEARVDTKPFGCEYDKMLWLETDMVYRPEDAIKLLQADADIVSAMYPMGPGQEDFSVAGCYVDGNEMRLIISVCSQAETDLREVEFCGLGMVAIRKGVFEAMQYPWFDSLYETDPNGTVRFVGDDFGFCKKARAHGFRIYVHNRVRAGHEKMVVL